MKKRIVGFVVCFALLLGFAHVALAAEGSALYIDTDYAIEGQTYDNGYVPTVSNNAAYIVLPLTTGQEGLSSLRVTPVFDAGVDSPFSYGNYELTVSWDPDKGIFPVTLDLPLKADRKNGAYPVEFQCAYMDAAGTAYTQSFTVQVTISDGQDPNWAAPTPTPPPVAGQLTIDSHTLYPGMALTYAEGYVPTILNGRVYIVLPLLGQTYDNRVTVTANLGELQNSPFVYGNYSQTVTGYGKYVFGLEIPLLMERYSGTYPVELRADYLDVTGKQASQTFPVYVTITDGKTPPDPNEAPRQEVEKPELFLSACKVEPETVGGEEEFSVAVTIDNIGAIRARSVRLSYGSEAAGIVPAETNNALHLENIASEDSAEVTFRMKTTKDVLAGQQPFYITLDYVDLYGGVYTNTRTFLIQVTQPAVMGYDPVSLPKEIAAGETVSLPANVFNLGKSTLRNVTVTLTGAGLFPTSSVFLGDIPPGEAGYGEMKVFIGMLSMTEGYTESYGPTTGVYTVSYQDDQGVDHAEETQVSTEIQQPVMEGEKTEAEKEAEAEAKRAASQWWISVLVAFAAIAIIVAVIVVNKFARMMRMK